MPLEYVSLFNFRNFSPTKVFLKKGLNIFFGKNGEGKTNFAESLLLLLRGKSFRKAAREELIKYGEDIAELEGKIEEDIVKIVLSKEERKVFLNGKRVSKADVRLKVFFINSDLLFYFKNSPHFRIKLIDKMCYNVFGAEFLIKYKRLIKSSRYQKIEPNNKIWQSLYERYSKEVDMLRVEFFKRIKKGHEEIKEFLNLSDCVIKFTEEKRKVLKIMRNDKKDLSLGELKALLFSIITSTISEVGEEKSILIFDDFNSEWDLDRQKMVKEVLRKKGFQCFLMESLSSEDRDFIIEKGEIKRLWH